MDLTTSSEYLGTGTPFLSIGPEYVRPGKTMSHPTNQSASDSERTANLTRDERHRLLAANRRRILVDVISEASTFELRELATDVAKREGGVNPEDGSVVEKIAISLHHTHLPIMAEAGVLSYDSEREQVTTYPGLAAI